MPLRLVESIIPNASLSVFDELRGMKKVLDRWEEPLHDDKALVRMLVDAPDVEQLLDELVPRFSGVEGFRVMLLPVEATLPRPPEPEQAVGPGDEKSAARINREELYSQISESAEISSVFIAQVIIATLVAAVGLMRDDTAVIIGAMVIAPLLGPNMSLSLATTLGDRALAKRSLKANLVGLTLAFLASLAIGFIFTIDPNTPSIASRTGVSGGDIILALASGCAGVLAFTSGAPAALIGVMVAVALLPPFVVFALLLASGEFHAASGALMLVATNVICVNLAGVVTFVVQGLKPSSWWEAKKASRATRIAVVSWVVLLAMLVVLIWMGGDY